MKLIAFTDPHIDFTTPVSRKDDYFEAIMAKLEFVLTYAEGVGARAVLCSGDFFDKPNQPGTVMHAVIKMLRRFDLDIYATVGQHDTNGHNADEYPIKSLGLLEAAGLLTVLRHGQSVVLDEEVCIRGYAFNELETEDFLAGRDEIPEDGLTHIALVHASVGPEDAMGRWAAIESQNIKSADLVQFGDIHCGFLPHQFRSGSVAFNPGSLGRRNIGDRGRKPQFAEIDVDKDGTLNLTLKDVPTLPDEDIFIASDDDTEASTDLAATFKAEWSKVQEIRDESNTQRVRRIGQTFGHSEEEIGLVLTHLPQEAA